MSTTFTTAFLAMYTAIPSGRSQIRIGGRTVIDQCMTSGVEEVREDTDMGQYQSVSATVRLLLSSDPRDGVLDQGKRIELKPYGQSEWNEYRIGGRRESGGVLALQLEAVHE